MENFSEKTFIKKENYKKILYDRNSKKIKNEEPYKCNPEFTDGSQNLINILCCELGNRYAKSAHSLGITGRVIVQFNINMVEKMENIRVARNFSSTLDRLL